MVSLSTHLKIAGLIQEIFHVQYLNKIYKCKAERTQKNCLKKIAMKLPGSSMNLSFFHDSLTPRWMDQDKDAILHQSDSNSYKTSFGREK